MDFWETTYKRRISLQTGQNHGLVRCEPDWCWDLREFKDFDLWIALDGSGEISFNQVQYPVTAGFTVCFPPGRWDVHARHDPEKPLRVFFCHFDLKVPPGANMPPVPEPDPALLQPDGLLWGTVRELADCLDTGHSPVLRENLLWQLLLRRERREHVNESSPEERVKSLIREIRESPAMARSIDQLARQAAMSTGHFRRLFRRLTGKSPVQFILDCRIDRAGYYLRETRLPVNRVATVVGYADVYFFSRQFKERTGLSPSVYRKTE